MNIYVGNISYTVTEEDLRQTFGEFGTVGAVSIIMDRETGRSRGFAFVEMTDDDQGRIAIEKLNGTDWMGRNLAINEARPRESGGRPGGGFDRGGGGRPAYERREGGPSSGDRGGPSDRSGGGGPPRPPGGGGFGGGPPRPPGGGGFGGGPGRGKEADRSRDRAGGGRKPPPVKRENNKDWKRLIDDDDDDE